MVPPMSMTNADSLEMSDWRDAKNAAPLIELVGPEELFNLIRMRWESQLGR